MLKMHYEYNNTGSNSTVVFLHGWGLNGNSFNSIINRIKNASTLKVDLYGFGQSVQPEEYFDTYEYAYQIFLLLKKLNIKNIVLVGHSFGGRVAIVLSSVFNIKVRNLLLTSSAGIYRFNLKTWLKIKWYKFLKVLKRMRIIPDDKLSYSGSVDYKNADKLMRRILVNVVNQDLKYLLNNISAKTLLVWDKKDKDTPYYICKTLRGYINNSKVVLYNNGGHFVAFKNINKFSSEINNIVING